MRFLVAVRKGLVEREVGQRKTAQRRLQVVAGIDADGAVRNVDAMSAHSSTQWQQGRRRVAKDARLAAIVFVKLHVAHPEQGLRRRVARVLGWFKTSMYVDCEIVFVVIGQRVEEIQVL